LDIALILASFQVFSLVVDLLPLPSILTLTNPRLRYILKGARLNPAVLPYRSVYGFPADAAEFTGYAGVMVKILTNARVREYARLCHASPLQMGHTILQVDLAFPLT